MLVQMVEFLININFEINYENNMLSKYTSSQFYEVFAFFH